MKKYLFYISQNYSFAILRPIQEILLQRGDQVYWYFEGNAVTESFLRSGEHRLRDARQIFEYRPDVVIATSNSIPGFLPGLKTCVFHGFDAGKRRPNGENDHFKIRGCYDLYCTQGPGMTRVFQEKQRQLGFFNVIETGWPALDPLFTRPFHKQATTTDILFCSTFSKRLSAAPILIDTIHAISREMDWQWTVQFHPKMPREIVEAYQKIQHEKLRFVETDDIIPLLQQADVMLSDTSSVITMFQVLHKPVVTFRNISPGPHLLDVSEEGRVLEALQTALTRPETLMQAITRHIEELHPYRDGRSSERVVEAIDAMLQGKCPVQRPRPRNFLRNLKFRKRLGYWRP